MKRSRTLNVALAVLAFLLMPPAVGLSQDRMVPPRPLPPPTIKLPPGEQPVRLTRFEVHAVVVGLHAETTATMTFFNPNGRVLAGELEFPLPEGAAVSGYGLDIGGRMVDEDRIRAVRDTLRREVRLRLSGEGELPEGGERVATEPDGTLRIKTAGDPLQWVAKLDPERVSSVEIGSTNLEPLYRRLSEDS